ncbi:hypothetical protein TRVA0_059S00386 [Trichomonascus vanleenenianus]|uniref:uncharacterized protein n=1 Tax=Trichomonascus vanleenenianus TaxID=2268995 RepID=UPI003EC9630A
MTESKELYTNAILSSVPPVAAADIVRDRLNRAKALNEEIADWARERARIENNYAAELEKLSRRATPSSGLLGSLSPTWTLVVASVEQSASSAKVFSHKLHAEIESPLRNFSSRSNQFQDVKQLQEGLTQLARQLVHAEEKLQHQRGNEEHQIQLAESRSSWESQAPYLTEQLEVVDEARLVLVKDSLTRMQTLEVDRAQGSIKEAEKSLNSILSFEPYEDMNSFASKVASGALTPRLETAHRTSSLGFPHPHHNQHPGGAQNKRLSGAPQRGGPFNEAEDGSSVHSKEKPLSAGRAKLRSKVGSIFKSRKKGKAKETSGGPAIREEEEGDSESLSSLPSRRSQHQFQQQQQQQQPVGAVGANRATTMPNNEVPAAPPSRSATQPMSAFQPMTPTQPVTASQPPIVPQPVSANQPPFVPQPVTATQPPIVPQSVTTNQPVADVSQAGNISSYSSPRESPEVYNNAPQAQAQAQPQQGTGTVPPRAPPKRQSSLGSKPQPPPSRKANVQPQSQQQPQQAASGDENDDRSPFRVEIKDQSVDKDKEDDVVLSQLASQLRSQATVSNRAQRGRRDIQSRLFTGIEPSLEEPASSPTSGSFMSQLQAFPHTTAGSAALSKSVEQSPTAQQFPPTDQFPQQSPPNQQFLPTQQSPTAQQFSQTQQSPTAQQFPQSQQSPTAEQFPQASATQQFLQTQQFPQKQPLSIFDETPGASATAIPPPFHLRGAINGNGSTDGFGDKAKEEPEQQQAFVPPPPPPPPPPKAVAAPEEESSSSGAGSLNLSKELPSRPLEETESEIFSDARQSPELSIPSVAEHAITPNSAAGVAAGAGIAAAATALALENTAADDNAAPSTKGGSLEPEVPVNEQPKEELRMAPEPTATNDEVESPDEEDGAPERVVETPTTYADSEAESVTKMREIHPIDTQFTGRSSLSGASSSPAPSSRHPELPLGSSSGLAATVVEGITANLKDGVVESASAIGEVAFGYLGDDVPNEINIRVADSSHALERVIPNPSFIAPSSEQEFRVTNANLIHNLRVGIVGLKYTLSKVVVPIIFTPVWRLEKRQASLMLVYKLADDFEGTQLTISDFVISVPVEGVDDVDSQAVSAQSRPTASFNRENQRITWRFSSPVTLNRGVEEKLLCRFSTTSRVHEAVGGINVKFTLQNLPLSSWHLEYSTVTSDPFSDDQSEIASDWAVVAARKTVAAARYTAHSEKCVTNV